MPEDYSCSRHPAVCLTKLSLCNWNWGDGDSLASTEVVIFSDMMAWLLDKAWTLGIQNINQTCCSFDRRVWYQILEGGKEYEKVLIQIITWGGKLLLYKFCDSYVPYAYPLTNTVSYLHKNFTLFLHETHRKKLFGSSLELRLLAHIPTSRNRIFYSPIWKSFKNGKCPHKFSRSSIFQKSNDSLL